ncbi:hypothetical protein HY419_01160 [candidate division WWE3 bacterium]|nr:hypothetical protein [candidate division WWE3 bacterium]
MLNDWNKVKVRADVDELSAGEYFLSSNQPTDTLAIKKGAGKVIKEREIYKLAHDKLRDLNTNVVVIAGSTGKTSSKDCIETVLKEKYKVFSGFSNHEGIKSLSMQIINGLEKDHRIFVCELEDIGIAENWKILELLRPNIIVITSSDETKLARFGSLEESIESKGELLTVMDGSGYSVLNLDDDNVSSMKDVGNSKKILYSRRQRAHVWAYELEVGIAGSSFILNISREGFSSGRIKVVTPLLGERGVSFALVASAVASIFGMSLADIKKGISKLSYPAGRLNVLRGVNRSIVLDDTYDSSPVSAISALEALKLIKGERRMAILSEMKELGKYEEEGHRRVGKKCAEVGVKCLLTIGEASRFIADSFSVESLVYGVKPEIIRVSSVEEAIVSLVSERKIENGDVILVKGDKSLRMERIVFQLMQDKNLSEKLLVKRI